MESTDSTRPHELARLTASRAAVVIPAVRQAEAHDAPPGLSPYAAVLALSRNWLRMLVCWAVVSAALCTAVRFALKPTYEASSLLRVEPTPQDLFGHAAYNSSTFQDYLETQAELIASTNMLLAASADPRVSGLSEVSSASDPEVVLRKMLRVNILPKSYLIRVTAASRSPGGAADVVNAVVNAYLKADAEWSEGMSRHLIKNLETYHSDLKGLVDEKQKAWLELASKGDPRPAGAPAEGDGGPPAPSAPVSLDEYQRVRAQLFQTELALGEAEAHLDLVRESARDRAAGAPGVDPDSEAHLDPEVTEIRRLVDQLKTQRATARSRVRDAGDPSVKSVDLKINLLERRHQKVLELKRDAIARRLTPAPDDPARQAALEAESRVTSLRAARDKLEAALGRMEVNDRGLGTDAVKAALIQGDLKHLEEMQAAVNRRLEQYRFEARGLARIRRISEARAPSRPASDRRATIMAATPLVVFGLMLGAFTVLEVKAGRIRSVDDVSRRFASDVFRVPPLPVAWPEQAKSFEEQSEEFKHQIDHLRDAICGGSFASHRGRCFVVTSAVDGEGKTVLSKNLAFRFASGGASTLLIDADLRRASLGLLLRIPESPGLSDVLNGTADVEDAVTLVERHGSCRFLPAGSPEANPGRLFLDHRLGPTLDRLRTLYDVIIIDTPPVLPVPDALTLGRWTDGAVLATRYDVSRVSQVEHAGRLLWSARVPILGVAVNGIRARGLGGGGYDYDYRSARVAQGRRPS